jgi:hypothetical protein
MYSDHIPPIIPFYSCCSPLCFQTVPCVLSCLFFQIYIPHIRGNMWQLSFWIRLILLNMMIAVQSIFLQMTKCSHYLWLNNTPQCVYVHNCIIHSSTDGHLHWFQNLTIVNDYCNEDKCAGIFITCWLWFLWLHIQ